MVCRLQPRGDRHWRTCPGRDHVYRRCEPFYPQYLEAFAPATNKLQRGGDGGENCLPCCEARCIAFYHLYADAIRHRPSVAWRDLDAPDLAFCCARALSNAVPGKHIVSGMSGRYCCRSLAFCSGGTEASIRDKRVWECFRGL